MKQYTRLSFKIPSAFESQPRTWRIKQALKALLEGIDFRFEINIRALICMFNDLAWVGSPEYDIKKLTYRDHARAQWIYNAIISIGVVMTEKTEQAVKRMIAKAVKHRSKHYVKHSDELRYDACREGTDVFESRPTQWTRKAIDEYDSEYKPAFRKMQEHNRMRHRDYLIRVQQAVNELTQKKLKITIRAVAKLLNTKNLRSVSKALAEIKAGVKVVTTSIPEQMNKVKEIVMKVAEQAKQKLLPTVPGSISFIFNTDLTDPIDQSEKSVNRNDIRRGNSGSQEISRTENQQSQPESVFERVSKLRQQMIKITQSVIHPEIDQKMWDMA